MTVRLRAHHLLCMLTFVGEGYTPAFSRNYRRIAERLSAGEDIELISGPDDICAPLMHETEPHCLRASVEDRDMHAALAVGELLGRKLMPGERIVPDDTFLAAARAAFLAGESRAACAGCEWFGLCTRVADSGFAGVRVGRPPLGGGRT